jgi:chromosome segregation ATPase
MENPSEIWGQSSTERDRRFFSEAVNEAETTDKRIQENFQSIDSYLKDVLHPLHPDNNNDQPLSYEKVKQRRDTEKKYSDYIGEESKNINSLNGRIRRLDPSEIEDIDVLHTDRNTELKKIKKKLTSLKFDDKKRFFEYVNSDKDIDGEIEAINEYIRLRERLVEMESATGKGEEPAGEDRILKLKQAIAQLESDNAAIDYLRDKIIEAGGGLKTIDTEIKTINTGVDKFYEDRNGTKTDEKEKILENEIEQISSQISGHGDSIRNLEHRMEESQKELDHILALENTGTVFDQHRKEELLKEIDAIRDEASSHGIEINKGMKALDKSRKQLDNISERKNEKPEIDAIKEFNDASAEAKQFWKNLGEIKENKDSLKTETEKRSSRMNKYDDELEKIEQELNGLTGEYPTLEDIEHSKTRLEDLRLKQEILKEDIDYFDGVKGSRFGKRKELLEKRDDLIKRYEYLISDNTVGREKILEDEASDEIENAVFKFDRAQTRMEADLKKREMKKSSLETDRDAIDLHPELKTMKPGEPIDEIAMHRATLSEKEKKRLSKIIHKDEAVLTEEEHKLNELRAKIASTKTASEKTRGVYDATKAMEELVKGEKPSMECLLAITKGLEKSLGDYERQRLRDSAIRSSAIEKVKDTGTARKYGIFKLRKYEGETGEKKHKMNYSEYRQLGIMNNVVDQRMALKKIFEMTGRKNLADMVDTRPFSFKDLGDGKYEYAITGEAEGGIHKEFTFTIDLKEKNMPEGVLNSIKDTLYGLPVVNYFAEKEISVTSKEEMIKDRDERLKKEKEGAKENEKPKNDKTAGANNEKSTKTKEKKELDLDKLDSADMKVGEIYRVKSRGNDPYEITKISDNEFKIFASHTEKADEAYTVNQPFVLEKKEICDFYFDKQLVKSIPSIIRISPAAESVDED